MGVSAVVIAFQLPEANCLFCREGAAILNHKGWIAPSEVLFMSHGDNYWSEMESSKIIKPLVGRSNHKLLLALRSHYI